MSEEIPLSIKKCISVLNSAKDDTEKLAALFMATKLLKGIDYSIHSKKLLIEAIEVSFLKRLLLCSKVPSGCSAFAYKEVAISILSALCCAPEIIVDPQILSCVPIFLDIVEEANNQYKKNETLIKDAYEYLLRIAAHELGKKSLLDAGAFFKILRMYSRYYRNDDALNILVILVERFGSDMWKVDINSFNSIMDVLSTDFKNDRSERKFKLCSVLFCFLCNSPKEVLKCKICGELWPINILKALNDILSSKLAESQRNPALILASQMVIVFGVEWTLMDDECPDRFFLLLIQLSSVEVRMQLEDREFDQIMENASVVTACFSNLEMYISYVTEHSSELDPKEQFQIYRAAKEALDAIFGILDVVSKNDDSFNVQEKLLIYAMIRVLSSWLAQDAYEMNNIIYSLMPFIFKYANESFYVYKSKIMQQLSEQSSKIEILDDSLLGNFNLLRVLLPALCQVTMEVSGRQTILQHSEDEVLNECLIFYYSVLYKKPIVQESEREMIINDDGKQDFIQETSIDLNDFRTAMVTICNVFMNFVVSEPTLVAKSATFDSLAKFVFSNLPELKYTEENLVLYGNMVVLGLSLLECKRKDIEINDCVVSRYIQCAIVFLLDGLCVEESTDNEFSLTLTETYSKYWCELEEHWSLSMRILGSILSSVPWVVDIIAGSGCIRQIMGLLKQVSPDSLPSNFKSDIENFLCRFVSTGSDADDAIKKLDAVSVCRCHKFLRLSKLLFGNPL